SAATGDLSVVECRGVVGLHRKFIIPAIVFAKAFIGNRNDGVDWKVILQRQRENSLDVVFQVSIDYQLALMDLFVHRIVLDDDESLPLPNLIRAFWIQTVESLLFGHLAVNDGMVFSPKRSLSLNHAGKNEQSRTEKYREQEFG